MNQAEASRAIFDRWIAAWPGLSGSTPYALDNTVIPEARPSALVNIVSFDSEQHTLGRRAKVRREGLIDVRLYGEVGVGRKQLDLLAGYARQVFERKRLAIAGELPTDQTLRTVVVRVGSVAELRRGTREAGALWGLSVTFPFEFYEVVSS